MVTLTPQIDPPSIDAASKKAKEKPLSFQIGLCRSFSGLMTEIFLFKSPSTL
jgi:hypothetical protein